MPNVVGHISQIIGPVVDVHFEMRAQQEKNELPNIHDALSIKRKDGKELIVEVQQHGRTAERNGSDQYCQTYRDASRKSD